MSHRLVIDASVAFSAGGPNASALVSKRCRDLLLRTIEDTDHYLVLSPDLLEEWREHASPNARGWLQDMIEENRVVALEDHRHDELHQAISAYAPNQGVEEAMQKDRHLIEAALKTDLRVLARDDTVRGHYSRGCEEINFLQEILWTNPCPPEEKGIDWVVTGAPREDDRLLCGYIS